MGLKGGDNGAKRVLLDHFSAAVSTEPTLLQARKRHGATRATTLCVADGNVIMMGQPSAVTSFEEFCKRVFSVVTAALEAAMHVVMVFDEPDHVTRAKYEEQAKRDRKNGRSVPVSSADLSACPTTDDYDLDTLLSLQTNVSLLTTPEARPARYRFFDAVAMEVLKQVKAWIGARAVMGVPPGSFTLDGIDERGANRPRGARRAPSILSSNSSLGALLKRDVPIGEGDLKLAEVAARVVAMNKMAEDSPFGNVKLTLVFTIDTDSLPIEMIQQARRDEEEVEVETLLCLRETGRKRKDTNEYVPQHFTVCNIGSMQRQASRYLLGDCCENARLNRASTALLAIGLSFCGCDYLSLEGARADVMLPTVRDVCHDADVRHQLLCLHAATSGEREKVLTITKIMNTLLDLHYEKLSLHPTARKAEGVRCRDESVMLRALWLCSYWHGLEFEDVENWGFTLPAPA